MSQLRIYPINHRSENRIALVYDYVPNSQVDQITRNLPGRKYSTSKKHWHIPYRKDYLHWLQQVYQPVENLTLHFSDENIHDENLGLTPSRKTVQNQKTDKTKVLIKIDRNKKKIYVDHGYAPKLFAAFNQLDGAFWLKERRSWVLGGTNDVYLKIVAIIEKNGHLWEKMLVNRFSETNALSDATSLLIKDPISLPDNLNLILNAYNETLILKRLSPKTQVIYRGFFTQFLAAHSLHEIEKMGYKELHSYIKIQSETLGETSLRQTIASIKFYYERTLGRDKMFFYISDKKPVEKCTLFLPLHEMIEICSGIDSPGDRLLLFLVYHANIRLSDICKLPSNSEYLFPTTHRIAGDDPKAIEFYKSLVHECHEKYHQSEFLIEDNGKPHSGQTLRGKLFSILGHYRIEHIYRKQYELILKNSQYSPKTQQMYLGTFMKFLKYFHFKHPAFIKDEDIKDYMMLHREKSASHQDNLVNAFKFFFERVHSQSLSEKFVMRPRKGFNLPDYFSQEEIFRMLNTTENLKHKLVISLAYTAGMRRQEIQNLKLVDIDLKRNRIFIKDAKGKRDRYSLFSKHLHDQFKTYLQKEKPRIFVFESTTPGIKYSVTSMSQILKSMAKSAFIQRNVHLHMLRHSFATHLLALIEDKNRNS
jgi:site-specific recombinase XerD